MHPQLVQGREDVTAVVTLLRALVVEGPDVFPGGTVALEHLAAVGAGEVAVHGVGVHVVTERQALLERLLADGAFEQLGAAGVRLDVADQRRVGQEALGADAALKGLRFFRAVDQHVMLRQNRTHNAHTIWDRAQIRFNLN